MHILCPHCHNAIEVVKLTSREEIACPSCGSSFCVETEATTCREQGAGQRLGKFELIDTVGHGAFGTVYKARDPELDRVVAIKADAPVGRLASSERILLGLWQAEFASDASLLREFNMKRLDNRRRRDVVTLIAAHRDIWLY